GGAVAPTEATLDYAAVDRMIETIEKHNALKGSRHTEVVLVVGARNLVYPEVHLPDWLDTRDVSRLDTLLKAPSYRRYLESTFRRYTSLPVLRPWQVEHEPLDYWHAQAESHGRALWITELQATPWIGTTGFTTDDLIASALAYRGHGVSAYLLWGVESWLDAPDWMQVGIESIGLLRAPDHPP